MSPTNPTASLDIIEKESANADIVISKFPFLRHFDTARY